MISSGLQEGKEPENDFALVWLSYSVHGNESSSTEAAMETLYSFANTLNKNTMEWLKRTRSNYRPLYEPRWKR